MRMAVSSKGPRARSSSTAARDGEAVKEEPLSTRVKQFVCRIDVCWTFFFFLFLICVGCITTAITQRKISVALRDSLNALHNARIFGTLQQIHLATERVYSITTGYLTLHSQHSFAINTEDNIATLCSILTMFDTKGIIRLFDVGSLKRLEAVACMHGDPVLGKAVLYGWMTENSITTGTYVIDNATYRFSRPLEEVYGGWPTSAKNITNSLLSVAEHNPAFQQADAFYEGTIEYMDPRNMWFVRDAAPHILYYMIPAALMFRGLTLPPLMDTTDFVSACLDGAQLLSMGKDFYASETSSAIFINASLTDEDPRIMSNSWGQESVNDTEIVTATGETPIHYLSVSTITDPLMRAALKHIDLKRLQEDGYSEAAVFRYDGAPAIVTAMVYKTKRGLSLPIVFVTPQVSVAGPYRRVMDICTAVTAVAIFLFTALLWLTIRHLFGAPLERLTHGMLRNLRSGRRDFTDEPPFQLVQLAETRALISANNNTIRQLREIDAFLPECVRSELQRGHGISASTKMQLSLRPPALPEMRRADKGLREHLSTVVYLTIRPDLEFERSRTETVFLPSTHNIPQRHLLATVVANAARSCGLTNSGSFSSPADLEAFLTTVHELCKRHHGAVLRLSPDSCTLHFHRRVRALLRATPPAADIDANGDTSKSKGDQEAVRNATEDAKDALAFAFDLQRWLEKSELQNVPDVRALADTRVFVCGSHCPQGSEQTLSVTLGRDVQREVGSVPAAIGVRIAMTEETARFVRNSQKKRSSTGGSDRSVRQLAVESLRTGRIGLDEDVVTLFEALPGPVVDDEAWRLYSKYCSRAFSCMLRGDYAAALSAYRGVMEISDLEPGLMPSSLRREAAASDVTGGAVSVQVERLMRECVQRVAHGVTSCFCRERQDPLGVDTVLRRQTPRAATPRRSSRALAAPLLRNETMVAKREGRYGVDEESAFFTRAALRYVGILPGSQVRTSYSGRAEGVTDNWGVKWKVAAKHVADRGHKMHNSLYIGLSESGNLCALTFRLYREVPAMVSRILRDAPDGAMTDAMRSAVPVWQPSAAQRVAVRTLLDARLRLRHPHILACLGYSMELEGGLTTALEYCKGGNLREVMARYDRMRVPTVCRTALSILLGLRYLHANGVVHGELRPECVLVCSDGVCRLKGFFADYALAHRVLCLPRTCYVSPEVAAGGLPTAASDVFGYGLVLLELLTQRLPWVWAPVVGEEAPRSAEDLAALAAAGGQVFSEAVALGRVVPAVERLDTPEVLAKGSPVNFNLLRCCLDNDPKQRLSLSSLISHAERIAAKHGVFLNHSLDASASIANEASISIFSA